MEIRSVGVSKGAAIERILGENDEDASVEEGSKESIHLCLCEMTPDLGNISTAEKN